MTVERWMRASDEDRENAVDVLRDAYAKCRLRSGEFYERVDAAYAATTWDDLDNLTADLPVIWTDAGLPSDVVSRGGSRTAGQSLFRQVIWVRNLWIFLPVLVLVAGLAGLVTSAAVWAACALVPLVVLLPLALDRVSGALRNTRRDGRQRELPGPGGSSWQH